jgi:endonuclease I
MDAAYPDRGIVNDHNGAMLSAWDTADPVDAMECRRAARIENVQRNINWIVRRRCENARLWP